mmetsp:Transcript_94177/g.266410  ORF Transcript_94177/g.266410 Transcript_94177/m.266410 type:complete len:239 (+) Transcript_94177:147-863(+)
MLLSSATEHMRKSSTSLQAKLEMPPPWPPWAKSSSGAVLSPCSCSSTWRCARSHRCTRASEEPEASSPSLKGAHLTATASLACPRSACRAEPGERRSQTRTSRSLPEVASSRSRWWLQSTPRASSCETTTESCGEVPARASQTCSIPSSPTVASAAASFLAKAASQRAPLCALRQHRGSVASRRPTLTSQTQSRPSFPPEARSCRCSGHQSSAKPSEEGPGATSEASGRTSPAGLAVL